MTFGHKITAAVRALQREGKLPANLRTTELEKRVANKLTELGHDPRTELPSRRTLLRHYERYREAVDDTTRPICPLCHVHLGAAAGMVDSEDLESQRGQDDMHQSDRTTMFDIMGAARTWLQVAPWDHPLDEVLAPGYLNWRALG
jgi:hypothetical protein